MAYAKVTSDHDQSVQDAVETVAMEQKLTSYRVYLASSRALLDLDTEVSDLQGDHVVITDSEDAENTKDSRHNLVETLLRREKLYQECLRSIFDVYAEPLRKFSSLSPDDHRVLFFSLEPILSFSTRLCLKLNDAIQTWDPGTTRIGNLFSKQFWHHYEEYYSRYPAIRSLLKEKRVRDEEFTQFCRMRHGAAHHSLESLLLLPIQRVSDYNTFLSRLLQSTDPSHPDYDDLKKALDKVEMMVKDREKQLQNVENEQRMDTVQDRFPSDDLQLQEKEKRNKNPLKRRSAAGAVLLKSLSKKHAHPSDKNGPTSSPSVPSDGDIVDIPSTLLTCDNATNRVYVLEGPVQLTAACQSLDRYLFLFSDLMLIAKQRASNMYKLKQRVRVSEIWLADCIDDVAESDRPHDRSMVIGWPTTNYVATFGSPQLMGVWREKLIGLISEEKEKEDKCCIIKIRYTAPEGCHACKTISVANTEDACSVVNRCIQEFHIQNPDTQEYQLWATSPKKDDPPYPLFGHEIPYAIRKSHEREWGRESGDDMIDSLRGLDLSYFTLQPAKKKPREPSLDDAKRAKKAKRSPLHGIFKKNQKHSLVSPSGSLFGHSLNDICDGDKLPQPILVILRVLFEQGPYTTGVFRKPGNHKKCQDIKTKLDRGEPVTVDELTVPVAASLFKDFLMSLPNCLLGSEYFDHWVATASLTEENEKDQRINLCKKYISSLSQSQQNLLRHLMCVLHTIAFVQKHHEQGMDAYGLAVCIGQSMLWASHPDSSSMSDTAAKVPSVVQFLIENCEQIFGGDSVKIFGELSQEVKPSPDSSTDSESIHSMLSSLPEQQCVNTRDNSSLDSLDRDCYYPEVDSSPQLAKSHLSPTNLSRDSGLTLSDTQLYDDCTENEPSSASARKQSFTRSYSQCEDEQTSVDPGTLSHSHNATTLYQSGLPVPPPRKAKRRSAGPELDSGNSASANLFSNPKKNVPNVSTSRLVSDDSTLGSLDEEYPEELLHQSLHLDQYRKDMDMGTLTKSESGAHLYLNDTEILTSHGNLQHSSYKKEEPLCSPQSAAKSKSSQHVISEYSAYGDVLKPGISFDLQSSIDVNRAESGGHYEHSISHDIHSKGSFTLSGSSASPSPETGACDGNSDLMEQLLTNSAKDHVDLSSTPHEATDYKQRSLDSSVPQNQSPFSASHVQLRNKSLPSGNKVNQPARARLQRADALDMMVLRKGMTPSGEDKFPRKIPLRTSLYSLDEDNIVKSVRQEGSDSLKPSKDHTSSSQFSAAKVSGSTCRRSGSYSGLAPAAVKHLQEMAIEKSASEPVINEQFELSGPVRAVAHFRPSSPPSYEEAIRRQSQLGTSEQDVVQQQQNSAKAKKLYEESLKKYEKGDVPRCCDPHKQHQEKKVRPGKQNYLQHPQFCRQPPPPYEQACQGVVHENKKQQSTEAKYNRYDNRQQSYPESVCRKINKESLNSLVVDATENQGLKCSQASSRHSSHPTVQSCSEQSQTELRHKTCKAADSQAAVSHPSDLTDSPRQHRDSPEHQAYSSPNLMDSPTKVSDSSSHHTDSPHSHSNSPSHSTKSSSHPGELPASYTDSPVHHINSPVHRTNSPVHHVILPVHRTNSPVHHVESSVHRTNSPVHHVESSVRHTNSSVHQTSASVHSTKSPRHRTESPSHHSNSQVHRTTPPVHRNESPSQHTDSSALHITSVAHNAGASVHCADSTVHAVRSSTQNSSSAYHSASPVVNLTAGINLTAVQRLMPHERGRQIISSPLKTQDQSENSGNRQNIGMGCSTQTVDSGKSQKQMVQAYEQAKEPGRQSPAREKATSYYSGSVRSASDVIQHTECDRARQQQHQERQRSRSRSRERRAGQRYSDPRLSSTKSTPITNLNRSKSDSQEHMDKVNRFRAFKDYENNKENISIEDLPAEHLSSEQHLTAERRSSIERIRTYTDGQNHKRSMMNTSVLKSTADQHQNGDVTKSSHQRHIQSSVRNRDWHKELASQYMDTFYQPNKIEETPNKVIKFGYTNKLERHHQSGEKIKPRWTPPVHPTKDLVYITKDDTHTVSRHEAGNSSCHVRRRDSRSKSQERPISLLSDDVQRLREYSRGRSDPWTENRSDCDGQSQTADVHARDGCTSNKSGVPWSVAKLREMYISEKQMKNRAAQPARASTESNAHFYTPGSEPPLPVFRPEEKLTRTPSHSKCYSQKQQYVKEITNPNADEAYV